MTAGGETRQHEAAITPMAMEKTKHPTVHRMGRRSLVNDYSQPGMYHITLRVAEGMGHPFGRVVGDASQPDGSPEAPRVELTDIVRCCSPSAVALILR